MAKDPDTLSFRPNEDNYEPPTYQPIQTKVPEPQYLDYGLEQQLRELQEQKLQLQLENKNQLDSLTAL